MPGLAERRAEYGKKTEDSREENCASTTKVEVQRVRHPATNKRRCNIRGSVHDTDNECIARRGTVNAEDFVEGQVCAVRASLIPTLDSSADGTSDDGEIEGSRLAPFVENLIADIFDF